MSRRQGVIRPAAETDLPAITEIYNQAVEERIATCDLSDVPVDERRGWLARHQYPYGVWVAVAEQGVRGWVALSPYDSKPCFHRTATFATYVHRAARGTGIGMSLRTSMIETAKDRGFHSLVNRVWANNEASIRLALKFGFKQVGHMRELVEVDGELIDCVFFQLFLADVP